jgi:hypothetical protein
MKAIQKAAAAMGRIGGKSRSKAKQTAARRNGALGGGDGRPRLYPKCSLYRAHRWNAKTDKCPCGYQRADF